MAHVKKFTRAETIGLASHLERKTNNHSNKDIDVSRSHLNYSLIDDDSNMLDRMQKRLGEVHVLNRKDVKVVCNWVVTLPETLINAPESTKQDFFAETFAFMEKRYGGSKNVVSGEVHMDETTPHLHFAFIPVVYDPKKQRDKVSAKEVLTRSELNDFHQALDKHLKEHLPGYKHGILNNKTLGLDSVAQIKLHDTIIKTAKNEAEHRLKGTDMVLKSKQAWLKSINDISKTQNLYPDFVKQKKTLTGKELVVLPKKEWESRQISVNERHAFERSKKVLEEKYETFKQTDFFEDFQSVKLENAELKYELKELKDTYTEVKDEMHIGLVLDKIYNRCHKHLITHFDTLFKASERVCSVDKGLGDFCKGFLSQSLNQKSLVKACDVGVESWNNGYDHIKEHFGLSSSLEEFNQNKAVELRHARGRGFGM